MLLDLVRKQSADEAGNTDAHDNLLTPFLAKGCSKRAGAIVGAECTRWSARTGAVATGIGAGKL